MPLTINDLQIRSKNVHCSSDLSNETCETFFQIWSHKAANISNDLIEYTIRHRQLDRLRFLLQTRNELSQRQNASPICQILTHIEDDLRRINEHIRRFCLSTRNLYRHLRSDSRIYPKMSIALDEGIIIKICRFIFKTKVLIKIISKEQSLNVEQDEQSNQKRIKKNDPYKNITKAFVALQSNFEILFGDVVEKDFFQNAKAAVQTLPIILDTSKTIRLIFCALYKLTEPERQAEVEAIRQRRLALGTHESSRKQQNSIARSMPMKREESMKFKTTNKMLKRNQSQLLYNSMGTHTKASSLSPNTITDTSANQLYTEVNNNHFFLSSSTSNKKELFPSSSSSAKTSVHSSKHSLQEQKQVLLFLYFIETKYVFYYIDNQNKSPHQKMKIPKRTNNKNASATHSASSNIYNESMNTDNNIRIKIRSSNQTPIMNEKNVSWTTWLHNAKLSLTSILQSSQTNKNVSLSKPLLTTWASLDRISKL
ncbi:unnamed protein product [Rotaria magnacalcarata]|uniref:Uncharacterized protein n=1 Tax=Rotaria magnacalcarata TaxID=392030 RepID=A0A819C2X2_9BILA|nr:unnamed protein product [Rotaria magnacalcarata]CAF3811946.1 unnamed protein product [Rotaria magnacalcarata]